MDDERVPFAAHVELLRLFLTRRAEVVARIEGLLNAQRKPPRYLQDAALLARHLDDCFFALPGIGAGHVGLKQQLDEAHWASGFKPRQAPGQHNDLIDPAELMTRAFLMWQRTRWPGSGGRVAYAHTLFALYLLRRLMLLAMRIFDSGSAPERLREVQRVLDELQRTAPPEQPVFVRDARWLFALAQSPTTDELHGYFDVAERIAEALDEDDRIETLTASVRMAGGHLRSQLRHVSLQRGVPLADRALMLTTRKSNALDVATLVQGLVPLFEAYARAAHDGDSERRVALADSILQGISPDPELFLERLDLLCPYSMIEHLFIATKPDGHAGYTPSGERHLRLLQAYTELLPRTAALLHEDCARFRPVSGTYSPYGVLYGFSSRLLEHMALKAAQANAATRFSLEDVFVAGDAGKLAWVGGWRNLPHVPRDVVKLFEYPQRFAEEAFARIEQSLSRRASGGSEANAGRRNGRLFVVQAGGPPADSAPAAAELDARFVVSSDRQLVAAGKATACAETELLHSRLEGELIVSYRTDRGWVGISKDVLTEVLGAGVDARIGGLPGEAAHVLHSMCPALVQLA